MSEDRRIVKTRETLCFALKKALEEKSFDAVSVKEICSLASVSRITFYARYKDKRELLRDLYTKLGNRALSIAIEQNRKNNRSGDPKVFLLGLLNAFSSVVSNGWTESLTAIIDENGYAYEVFINYLRKNALDIIKRLENVYVLRFSREQTVAIMCDGVIPFMKTILSDQTLSDADRAEICSKYYGGILDICIHNA